MSASGLNAGYGTRGHGRGVKKHDTVAVDDGVDDAVGVDVDDADAVCEGEAPTLSDAVDVNVGDIVDDGVVDLLCERVLVGNGVLVRLHEGCGTGVAAALTQPTLRR